MASVLGICVKRHRKWRKTSCGNACNVTRTGGKYHWLCPRLHKNAWKTNEGSFRFTVGRAVRLLTAQQPLDQPRFACWWMANLFCPEISSQQGATAPQRTGTLRASFSSTVDWLQNFVLSSYSASLRRVAMPGINRGQSPSTSSRWLQQSLHPKCFGCADRLKINAALPWH